MNDLLSKWWVMILLGLGIGAYSVWQIMDTHSLRAAKGLLLAVICVVVGLWSKSQASKTED